MSHPNEFRYPPPLDPSTFRHDQQSQFDVSQMQQPHQSWKRRRALTPIDNYNSQRQTLTLSQDSDTMDRRVCASVDRVVKENETDAKRARMSSMYRMMIPPSGRKWRYIGLQKQKQPNVSFEQHLSEVQQRMSKINDSIQSNKQQAFSSRVPESAYSQPFQTASSMVSSQQVGGTGPGAQSLLNTKHSQSTTPAANPDLFVNPQFAHLFDSSLDPPNPFSDAGVISSAFTGSAAKRSKPDDELCSEFRSLLDSIRSGHSSSSNDTSGCSDRSTSNQSMPRAAIVPQNSPSTRSPVKFLPDSSACERLGAANTFHELNETLDEIKKQSGAQPLLFGGTAADSDTDSENEAPNSRQALHDTQLVHLFGGSSPAQTQSQTKSNGFMKNGTLMMNHLGSPDLSKNVSGLNLGLNYSDVDINF